MCGAESSCGVLRYKVINYADFNPVIGQNWHFRGINLSGDFYYVILSTVEFYLHKRKLHKEYFPSADGFDDFALRPRDLGYMLVFMFVRGDGTREEFGHNSDIFLCYKDSI